MCSHSTLSLQFVPMWHNRRGNITEIKVRFVPLTMCRRTVISGNAKSKVLKAAKTFLKGYSSYGGTEAYNKIKKMSSYNFYFKAKKVYICFESYELGLGAGSQKFSVTGKYKSIG